MVTDELLEFVRTEHGAGMPESDLKELLIAEGGWDASDVDEAFHLVGIGQTADTAPSAPPAAPLPQTPDLRASSLVSGDVAPSAHTPPPSPFSSATAAPPADLPVAHDEDRPPAASPDDFLGIFSEVAPSTPQSAPENKESDERAGIASASRTRTSPERPRDANDIAKKREEALLEKLAAHTLNTRASTSGAAAAGSAAPWSGRREENVRPKTSAEVSSVRFSLTDALRSAMPKGETPDAFPEASRTIPGSTALSADPQAASQKEIAKEGPSVDIRLGPSPSGREQIVSVEPPTEISPVEPPVETSEAPAPSKTSAELSSGLGSPEKKVVFNVAAIAGAPSSGTIVRDGTRTKAPDLPPETTRLPAAEHSATGAAATFAKRTMASDILLQGMRSPAMPPAPPAASGTSTAAPLAASAGFSGISSVLLSGTPGASSPLTPPKDEDRQKDAPGAGSSHVVEPSRAPTDEKKPRSIAAVLGIVLGLLLVAAALGAFLLWGGKMGGPDAAALMKTAATRFFGASTWSYESTFSVNVTLGSAGNSGALERSVLRGEYQGDGIVGKSAMGFGDGTHRLALKGESGADGTLRTTDVSLEVRRIGNTLFLRVVKAPPGIELPADFLDTYWIRIDLAELGRELGWKGLEAMGEGYGVLAGGSAGLRFENITLTEFPFAATAVTWTGEKSARRATIALAADPNRAIAFMQALYRKFTNKDLFLSDEDRVRLSDALRKVRGELVVNEASGMPERLALAAELDDTLFGKHVTGSAAFTFAFGNFDAPFSVAEPMPTLSTEELQNEIERYRAIAALKARDDERIAKFGAIRDALEAYRAARGKYPLALGELHASGMLATTTVAAAELKEYAYAAYIDAKNPAKTGRCSAKGKTCAFYHIGVNLEYLEHPALKDDADLSSDIRGSDAAGCTLEKERACYDLVAPEAVRPETSTSTPKIP